MTKNNIIVTLLSLLLLSACAGSSGDSSSSGSGTGISFHGKSYGTVTSSLTGKIWLDRNLGADNVCTHNVDSTCYGDYYQWGRGSDGHEKGILNSDSNTIAHNSTADNKFKIYVNGEWANDDVSGSLRDANWAKTTNNPICPTGFRVPSAGEIDAEIAHNTNGSSARVARITALVDNGLKIPYAGYKTDTTANISNNSSQVYLWSHTRATNPKAEAMNIQTTLVLRRVAYDRSLGIPIRCIKN